jgi:hypothetical protein
MRRSQRLSSSGNKSRYFEDDGGASESDNSIAPKQTSKRTQRSKVASLDSEGDFDESLDDHDASRIDGDESDKPAAAPPRKRGRPAKATPKATPKATAKATPKRTHTSNDSSSLPRKRGRPAKETPAKRAKAELEHDDEEDEDDSDDDGPRIEFISLPKLRDTGGIEYEPERIHPNTMEFLKDLKANNTRSWLKSELPVPHT